MKTTKAFLQNIVTVDMETYWASDFSLSNQEMNTSSYVRDPRFKVHCIGIKDGLKKAKWYEPHEGWKQLHYFDWTKRFWLSHNALFDGFIASHHEGIVPCFYLDTLAMTRGLHFDISRAALGTIAKFYGLAVLDKGRLIRTKGIRNLDPWQLSGLGEMCRIDTETCFDVFRFQAQKFPWDEMRLIDWATRCFCDPVLYVDEQRAKRALGEELLETDYLIEASGATREELNSNARFAQKLADLGVAAATKISLKTDNELFAFAKTDPEFNELLEHEDKRVALLAHARLAAKSTIDSTRAMRLIEAGKNGMRLPIAYNYAAAKTLRFGGTNKMNLLNFRRGGELRKSIIAKPGYEIVTADSAQIEARLNDYTAGQEDALKQWRDYDAQTGPDPYKVFASGIYGKDVSEITGEERFIGKTCVLGLGYQMGAPKLQTTFALGTNGPAMELSLKFCDDVVKLYRKKRLKVVQQWALANNILLDMAAKKPGKYKHFVEYDEEGSIWLPSGMGLHYLELSAIVNENTDKAGGFQYKSHDWWTKIFGGKLVENLIQALARIIVMNHQMLEIADSYRVCMSTYDEVSCHVPKKQVDACKELMLKVMRTPPWWAPDLPLNAEVKSAPYYCK